jgi:hypothetical protein
MIPFKRTINNRLRQCRIELRRRTLNHRDPGIATSTKVSPVQLPQLAPSSDGVEIRISGPPVVASDGRAAVKISTSALATSSLIQNAHSEATTATHVRARIRRKCAARTSMPIPLLKRSVSLTGLSTNVDSIGDPRNAASM